MAITLPVPVGPISHRVIMSLLDGLGPVLDDVDVGGHDPLDHDLQLALYVLNELHYSGWGGVSADLEWDPDVTDHATAHRTVSRWRQGNTALHIAQRYVTDGRDVAGTRPSIHVSPLPTTTAA